VNFYSLYPLTRHNFYYIHHLAGRDVHKPPTASLLDLLPPWPWYILWMEAIGLVVMCLILYLPFAVKDWRAKARAS